MTAPVSQSDKARAFKALHVAGAPVILYNIWDAGSARAVAAAGARALATGSWSVAEALGHSDGQALPLADLLRAATGIVGATDLPTSVDFEGCYATVPAQVQANVALLIGTGAVGLNFEDQVVGGNGLHPMEAQALRVAAVRAAADAAGLPFVINARTDLFLKEKDAGQHAALMSEAIARAGAYTQAGADCFFVPGLTDLTLMAELCAAVPLPVNAMHTGDPASLALLAHAGVARISHGPKPWRDAMAALTRAAAACYS